MSVYEAIHSRHSKDLVVGECKDGPTYGGGHLRLDYWVLRRSWAKPAMIGYEVKSGRQDFLKDDKWRNYLPLCNELWFIEERRGSIKEAELPESVGLLRLAGSRLITVRKAVWREIPFPETLATYVLMCRAKITTEAGDQSERTAEFWRSWLAEKEDRRKIGREVAKALRERYRREVEDVRRENERLREEHKSLVALREALAAKKIEWQTWTTAADVEKALAIKPWHRHQVEDAYKILGNLVNGVSE